MRHIEIEKNDADQRIDRFIKKLFPKMNKNMIGKLIRTKKIKLNKKKTDANQLVKLHDVVDIYIYEEELSKYEDHRSYRMEDFNLTILYEDDDIIVMDKPRNLLTHAASPKDYGKTLVDQMIHYLIKTDQYHPRSEKTFIPAVVNRLDRNTSGVVLGCKTAKSLRYFNEIITGDQVSKIYECIIVGSVQPGVLNYHLEKRVDKNMVSVGKNGKESITEILSCEQIGDYALLTIRLKTGRTHQIRSHLKHIGHPIIGDPKYGNRRVNELFFKRYGLKNQLLRAKMIQFENLSEDFQSLSGKSFQAKRDELFERIYKDLENKNDRDNI